MLRNSLDVLRRAASPAFLPLHLDTATTEPDTAKDIRRERLWTVIETHFLGSRQGFCERFGVSKARVSKMLTAFGPGTARKIEIELGLPIHFLDGADGLSEVTNASLGHTRSVYLTEREQQIITAFRLA